MVRRLFCTLILIASWGTGSAAAQEKKFRAGAFAADITPTKFPDLRQRRHARPAGDGRPRPRCTPAAWCSTTARRSIAFVVCDSCMIPREVTDAAKTLRPEGDRHSAANASSSRRRTRTPRRPSPASSRASRTRSIRSSWPRRSPTASSKAIASLAPAKIGWGVGKDPTQVFNRRWKMKPGSALLPTRSAGDRQGQDEPRLPASRPRRTRRADRSRRLVPVRADARRPADRAARQLLAALRRRRAGPLGRLLRRCSPSASATLLGADERTAFVGIMSNGTSGDINNVNFGQAGPGKKQAGEQARIVADSVAKAAFDARTRTIEHRDWVPLADGRRRRSSSASAARREGSRTRRGDPRRRRRAGADDAAGDLRPRDGAAWRSIRRR